MRIYLLDCRTLISVPLSEVVQPRHCHNKREVVFRDICSGGLTCGKVGTNAISSAPVSVLSHFALRGRPILSNAEGECNIISVRHLRKYNCTIHARYAYLRTVAFMLADLAPDPAWGWVLPLRECMQRKSPYCILISSTSLDSFISRSIYTVHDFYIIFVTSPDYESSFKETKELTGSRPFGVSPSST